MFKQYMYGFTCMYIHMYATSRRKEINKNNKKNPSRIRYHQKCSNLSHMSEILSSL